MFSGFYCFIKGNSMMTRKDNDLITFWNEGFRKIRASGEYTRLCNQAIKEHGVYT